MSLIRIKLWITLLKKGKNKNINNIKFAGYAVNKSKKIDSL